MLELVDHKKRKKQLVAIKLMLLIKREKERVFVDFSLHSWKCELLIFW